MYLQLGDMPQIDGRYAVEERIGEGGMAVVYRIRHSRLGTQHALKVVSISSKSVRRRLMQEGRVQAALRHPNVVAVTDLVELDAGPGLVMEYIDGPDLDAVIGSGRELTLDQVDAIALGILDGVAAAHALDLIHRDLKPGNVMLAVAGTRVTPKVADFGLVKLVSGTGDFASKTRTGVAMGTPAYMAPEQVKDAKNVDARADVWSLGAIFFELLAGERAFDGEDLLELMTKVRDNERASIRELCPHAPERMLNAIEAALVADPDERVPDVAALRALWVGESVPHVADAFDAEFVAWCRALGAGGEDAESFLRRSFRHGSDAPPASAAAPKGTQPTWIPVDDAVDAVDAVGTTGPTEGYGAEVWDEPDTIEPHFPGFAAVRPAPPADRPVAPRRGMATLLGFASVGVAGTAAALGAAIAFMGWSAPETVPATHSAPVVVVESAQAAVEAPEAEAAQVVAPVEPAPVKQAPVRRSPAKKAPAKAAPSAPEPAVEPAPEPAAGTADAVVEAPAPAASAAPLVSVDSDVTVLLRTADGATVEPAAAGPGAYQVVAFFSDREPRMVGDVVLGDGQTSKIRCSGAQERCVIR